MAEENPVTHWRIIHRNPNARGHPSPTTSLRPGLIWQRRQRQLVQVSQSVSQSVVSKPAPEATPLISSLGSTPQVGSRSIVETASLILTAPVAYRNLGSQILRARSVYWPRVKTSR